MKTIPFSRAPSGALMAIALTGIAGIGVTGFAAAQMKDHGDHAATTNAPSDRKIKYYRHPMGLPDTSPVPKKDSMGMDYIAVHEGEDSDDGSVKVSPGKIQRTGVRSEPAVSRTIRSMIHVPGVIQLDERRISVIAMRSESYVQKVENITIGTHVVKGQPLMEVYSPAVSSAAAEYISTINSKTTAGDGLYGRGSRQRLMNLDVPDAAIVTMEKSRQVPIGIEWTSPRDGVVLERNAIEGMRAQPGAVLFRIADHALVWAVIDVAERDLAQINVGTKVVVLPDRQHQASGPTAVGQPSRAARSSITTASTLHASRVY
jgi:Cu(I)/Ag(I) efflux system membrane fusion protein